MQYQFVRLTDEHTGNTTYIPQYKRTANSEWKNFTDSRTGYPDVCFHRYAQALEFFRKRCGYNDELLDARLQDRF